MQKITAIICEEVTLALPTNAVLEKDDGTFSHHSLFDHSPSLFAHQEQPKPHQHIMKINTFILALTLAASAKVYAEVRRTWTPSTETHHLTNDYDLLCIRTKIDHWKISTLARPCSHLSSFIYKQNNRKSPSECGIN
jgi:hypothetical protein